MLYKFVTEYKSKPKVKEIVATLERQGGGDGVSLLVDGYYICTLRDDGTLKLHSDVRSHTLQTDCNGYVITAR